jgi:hypothetical protein
MRLMSALWKSMSMRTVDAQSADDKYLVRIGDALDELSTVDSQCESGPCRETGPGKRS